MCRPFGEISGKPNIKEIELGSFENTFQDVVGVGLQEIYDIWRYKYGKLSFGSRDAYSDISCKRRQVEKLPDRSGCFSCETRKFYCIADLGQFLGISFNIGIYIGAVKQSPVVVWIACKLGYAAVVDLFHTSEYPTSICSAFRAAKYSSVGINGWSKITPCLSLIENPSRVIRSTRPAMDSLTLFIILIAEIRTNKTDLFVYFHQDIA